jgi:hypothetical protein
MINLADASGAKRCRDEPCTMLCPYSLVQGQNDGWRLNGNAPQGESRLIERGSNPGPA